MMLYPSLSGMLIAPLRNAALLLFSASVNALMNISASSLVSATCSASTFASGAAVAAISLTTSFSLIRFFCLKASMY